MDIRIYPNQKNFPFGGDFNGTSINFIPDLGRFTLPGHFDPKQRKLLNHPLYNMFEALRDIDFEGMIAHVSLGKLMLHRGDDERILIVPDEVAVMLTISDVEQSERIENNHTFLWKTPKGTKSPVELFGPTKFFGPTKKADTITKFDWRHFFNQVIKTHLLAAKNQSKTRLKEPQV